MVKQFESRGGSSRGGFGGRGGAPRGGRGGFGGRGGRGGFGGGQRNNWDTPPASVIEVGVVQHPCEEYLVIKNTLADKVPIFGRPVYLENKTKIGIIDDVFGPINEFVKINLTFI
jgi:H/ACA ribonucleoprotein complex subunit 1